jgi:hypothetical protein
MAGQTRNGLNQPDRARHPSLIAGWDDAGISVDDLQGGSTDLCDEIPRYFHVERTSGSPKYLLDEMPEAR